MATVILLIAGAAKEPHSLNEDAQRETWARDFSFPVYWIHGDAPGAGRALVETVDTENRRIDVALPENFSNLLEKSLRALQWALDSQEFDFVVRSNSSSFWNEAELVKLIATLPRSGLYAGPIGTWSSPGGAWDYIGGSALFMSRDVAEVASRADVSLYRNLPDDVALGHWMREVGVKPVALRGSRIVDYEPPTPAAFSRMKHWTDAKVTRSRMRRLDRVYRSQDFSTVLRALAIFNLWELLSIARDPRWKRWESLRLIVHHFASWPAQARRFKSRLRWAQRIS